MSRLHTPVCDLLGIEFPIFQGGMATHTSAELVAAVSNAGGLGIIGGLGRNRDDLRDEIRRVRNLTSKPFGVNHVVCRIDDACVELTLAQRVPVISLSWGRAAELTARAHEAGLKVVHQVTTPEEAGGVAAEGALIGIAGAPVQVRNPDDSGVQVVQGPFLRSGLPIAGFAVIDAVDLQDAIRLVSKVPCAVAHGVVEVWPLQGT